MQICSYAYHTFDIYAVWMGFRFSNWYYLIIISAEKHAVIVTIIFPSSYCIPCRIVTEVRLFPTSDKVRWSKEFWNSNKICSCFFSK